MNGRIGLQMEKEPCEVRRSKVFQRVKESTHNAILPSLKPGKTGKVGAGSGLKTRK